MYAMPQDVRWRDVSVPCIALLAYLLCSSLIVVLNKRLLVDEGFHFPLALTGLGQMVSAAAGVTMLQGQLLSRLGVHAPDSVKDIHDPVGAWHLCPADLNYQHLLLPY